jgi:hypothetical protein
MPENERGAHAENSRKRGICGSFLCLLPPVIVALAMSYVNVREVPYPPDSDLDKGIRQGSPPPDAILVDLPADRSVLSQRDFHLGWPTTYRVAIEMGFSFIDPENGWGYSKPTLECAYFSPFHLGINLLWGLGMVVATWVACIRFVATVRRAQFSLKAMLLAVTVTAFCIFMAIHYEERSSIWPDYEMGRPYLLAVGLCRWFGPRSLYDWLWHFSWFPRTSVLVGCLCMAYLAFSWPLAMARRYSSRSTGKASV